MKSGMRLSLSLGLTFCVIASPSRATTNTLPEITCWGDSLTQNGIAVALAELYSGVRKVNNQGVGGEPSTAIAVRQGGTIPYLTFQNNTIPSTGATVVAVTTANGNPKLIHSVKGTVLGINGTLSRHYKTNTYTWTRTVPGIALEASPGVPMIVDTGNAGDHTVVLWFGRNNVATDVTAEYVKSDLQRAIAHLAPSNKRFAVLGITRSDYSEEYTGGRRANRIETLNRWIKAQWPENYIDTMTLLLAAKNPTNTQDSIDVTHGIVPSSLRMPGDKTHLNPAGNAVIANEIKKVFDQKGW